MFDAVRRRLKQSPHLGPVVTRAAAAIKDWAFLVDVSRRKRLRQEWDACTGPAALLSFSRTHLHAAQQPQEILDFADAARCTSPAVLCEIGTLWGGTHCFLTHALPSVNTTIAVDFLVHNRAQLRFLAKPGQRSFFIDGPSCSVTTVERVAAALTERAIDLLFIDGDHRYESVRADFLTYRRFVRDGGLIAFHDICEDEHTRFGVPLFWKRIRQSYGHQEFVESPGQRGFGIGVIVHSNAIAVPEGL